VRPISGRPATEDDAMPSSPAAPRPHAGSPLARATRDGELFLLALFGCERRGALIDVCHRAGHETRRLYFAHRDTSAAARTIVALALTGEVRVGVAPRRLRDRGDVTVERVWALWVELERPDARAALEQLPVAPSIVVADGASRVSAYWLLRAPATPAVAERANRRLAAQLGAGGGDGTRATAMLRPPGTRCWDGPSPAPVVLERLRPAMTTVQAATAGIARDPASVPAAAVAARSGAPEPAPLGQEPLPAVT
jgi:hypothetical protein